jgi:hypothetical protein
MRNLIPVNLKPSYLILTAVTVVLQLFAWNSANGQACPVPACQTTVPKFCANFVGDPGATFVVSSTRTGSCCPQGDNNCVGFNLTLDTNTAAVNFEIIAGAIPQGSLFYRLDCGPEQVAGSALCVTNNTGGIVTRYLTFCKPGNNANTYRISNVPKPTFNDLTVPLGCFDTVPVFGLNNTGATYQSISPGLPGQYNNLLSCTSGCARPVFTPLPNSPTTIQYLVCGTATASACLTQTNFCDTITVTVAPVWSDRPDTAVCAPATTLNIGTAPTGSTWSFVAGPATATINATSGAISGMTLNGVYTFVARTNKCTDTVRVSRNNKPDAGADQFVCFPISTTTLFTAPVGATWSFLNGPAAAAITPSTGVITGMTAVGTYNFRLSAGTGCSDTVAVVVRPQPASPTAGNNGPLCVGATLNLTASTVSGATYSWTGPSGFASTLQNPTVTNVGLANAGVYTVVSIINTCPSQPATTTVVVNPIPPAPGVSSNSPVCETETINLFASGEVGASYNWTGPNLYVSTTKTRHARTLL